MSSSISYNVVIFLDTDPPHNVSTNPPPINSILSSLNSTRVPNPIFYEQPPSTDNYYDTCLGRDCGQKNCGTCDKTFQIKPSTVDYLLLKKLLEIWEADQSLGIIFAKPSTITTSTASTIEMILADVETNEPDFDFFYFAKWLDKAEQYEVIQNYPNNGGMKLIRTRSPHGFQAIAFSPKGMRELNERYNPSKNPVLCRPFSQVLNMLVENGTFNKVYSTTPPLFFYNSLEIVNKTYEQNLGEAARFSYLKTCEVRGLIHPEEPLNRRVSSDISTFYLILIFLVIIATIIGVHNFNKHFSS